MSGCNIRLISRPIYASSHELWYTDTNTPPTRVISKRILVELLGIREESVIFYLWGMKPIIYVCITKIILLVCNLIFLTIEIYKP
jgi:hypothetical protein